MWPKERKAERSTEIDRKQRVRWDGEKDGCSQLGGRRGVWE